ncbi:glutathione-disulfide reductase [Acetobacter sp.]|jgi:glutathione reductase (NADPH)|uniref:glutathione-disulfide reductase n=1 Tax=Acetobacter sp. TaxID=440 RepID=UPI0025C52906|nr:glutathione-disulfide reductase [Acetobacter sp.]MCH4091034.1 glutathione-disulfide reductase [Acetobacter sp.]MCI1300217.1 glutathione-disulfide reductase [Acetobacter sp.]MCI1316115.1 glutathione-disulfide reductase [Acetobacter sp.]
MPDRTEYDVDLLVIGAGSGGVRCARIAAGHGAKVAVVESRHWGGTCVNLGCVPKKLMVQASEYGNYVEDSHGFGWSTEQGSFDWSRLIAAKDKEISRLNGIYVSMLEKAGVKLLTGFASFEDAHTILVTPSELAPDAKPERITAKQIVIATGSTPSKLDIEGSELAITSDEVFGLREMPERVCIIGSGYIGIEFAGIFAGLGAQVDLVYRQTLPLRGFDEDLREALHEAISQRGVTQHVQASPTRIRKEGEALVVTLDNGVELTVDCVLMATGRHPKSGRLGLENTRVRRTAEGRIEVDRHFETAEPGVFAIGDVTNHLNLTPVAIAEGHILADRLFADQSREWSFDTTPKAVFFTPPLASVGLSEAEAAEKGVVDVYVSKFRPMRHTLSGRERRTLMKLVVDQATQKVVGVHMLGEDAPELMQGLAIAVTAGLRKADFDRTIGIHPTSAEEFVTMRTRTRVAGD